MPNLAVVILAAGKGTRMRSELPKALHTLCGEPMLGVLLQSAEALRPRRAVVVAGYKSGLVREFIGRAGIKPAPTVIQQRQLWGSGHAVARTAGALSGFDGPVLLLYCDTPLISAETMKALLKKYRTASADCALLSVVLKDAGDYGRIKRTKDGSVEKIVEAGDANPAEKAIREINVGCYVFNSKKLFGALKFVRRNPRKKEYYLTDAVEILAQHGCVEAVKVKNEEEVLGINTRQDLATLQDIMQKKILDRWIGKGVQIRDPRTTTIDAGVTIGPGTVVLPNTVIEDRCIIGKGCAIGPFARLRGGSKIGDGSVIGNFVEVVRSTVGKKSLIKHLSYIGDAEVGSFVNIGAGTITANFDGKKKHKTVIKDKAQLGSGTVLVAPVTVGRAAKTGAGAVVTKGHNVPDGAVVAGVPARPLPRRKL